MASTRTYDHLNRLREVGFAPASGAALTFRYDYNAVHQRSRMTEADGNYCAYAYDGLGQVTEGVKHWAEGTVVSGQKPAHTSQFFFDPWADCSARSNRTGPW